MPEHRADPKAIITPDAFAVADELLGTPLARPWRRGMAMAIDLLIIAVVAGVGISWLLLFLAIAVLAGRAALRPAGGGLRKVGRLALFGSLAAVASIATVLAAVELFSGFDSLIDRAAETPVEAASQVGGASQIIDAVRTAGDVAAMASASTPEELTRRTRQFVDRLERLGAEPSEIREAIEEIASEHDEEWARAAMLSALGADTVLVRDDPDSLALAYAAAIQAGDSARIAGLEGPLIDVLAADRIDRIERENRRLARSNRELEAELEQEEERGLLNLILRVANEVGIDIGWSALYFTLFPVFWSGRTPGKRALGIRIVRLDAGPLGWWAALNRFGGYAASVFTGLLGFAEMFWDDNRQAMQDRIASTVVVRE